MKVTQLALRRPVTMVMIIIGLMIMGLVSYQLLPVRQLPNVHYPFIQVTVDYPGATPQDVRLAVTDPIENALTLVNGIKQMSSVSLPGMSQITLQFVGGTRVTTAANDVAQAVGRIAGHLPAGAGLPSVIEDNPAQAPIMDLVLAGRLSPTALYALATQTVVPALEAVPGVAAVDVVGGAVPQLNVKVNPLALVAYHTSLSQVRSALVAQNATVAGGSVQSGPQAFLVRTQSPYTTPAALESLIVSGGGSRLVTLGEVAHVSAGFAAPTTINSFDNRPAVGLTVAAQSNANSLGVDSALVQTLHKLRRVLPPGVRVKVTGDTTVYTRAALAAVSHDLLIAIALTGLVLFLFLHRREHILIVLLAIPTSLVSTFTVMFALGFSLDLMSLLALSLLIGILVDDSIVVLENIHRHLTLGEAPQDAALNGRMEIGGAAVAITLTDVVVYAPVAFVSGNIGQLFREFGLTIVAATLFSLFVSFTLTPLLAARWLKLETETASRFAKAWDRGWERVGRFYRGVLARALGHRWEVVAMATAALGFSIAVLPLGLVGTAYIPTENADVFQVALTMPSGTSLGTTARAVALLSSRILRLPGVTGVFATSGTAVDGLAGVNDATLTVDRAPYGPGVPPITVTTRKVRALAAAVPGALVATIIPSPLVAGGVAPLAASFTGPDIAELGRLATQAARAVAREPGLVEVQSSATQSAPEWSVRIRRVQAARFGLTALGIGTALETAIQGSVASTFQPAGLPIEESVLLTLRGASHLTGAELMRLPIAAVGGHPVFLGDVARVTQVSAPEVVYESGRQLAVEVTANLQGIPLGLGTARFLRALHTVALPPGYSLVLGGQSQSQANAFGPLVGAFALSVVLVYMLMAALYESMLDPMVVLFSLPLATVGAFLALMITGQTLNIFSLIGMIMLMGLVAKNAILLVDYTRTLRGRGRSRREALLESGQTRLRPILMTTGVMVAAMTPLAIHSGSGASDRGPMAVVLIGGLVTSTLLTLIVVPVVYTLLDDLRARSSRRVSQAAAASES